MSREEGSQVGASGDVCGLDWRGSADGELLIAGARVVDPRAGIDGERDLVIRSGRIARTPKRL